MAKKTTKKAVRPKTTPRQRAMKAVENMKDMKLPPGFSVLVVYSDAENGLLLTDSHHVFHKPTLAMAGQPDMIDATEMESHIRIGAVLMNHMRQLATKISEVTPLTHDEVIEKTVLCSELMLKQASEGLEKEPDDG